MIAARQAQSEDAAHIARNLADEERVELLAWGIEDVEAYLLEGIQRGDVTALEIDGRAEALFGITVEDEVGYIFAAPTTTALKHWRTIHRYVPAILDELGRDCLVLSNAKYTGSVRSIRWLKHLGFTFINTFPAGPMGLHFHEFVRIQP